MNRKAKSFQSTVKLTLNPTVPMIPAENRILGFWWIANLDGEYTKLKHFYNLSPNTITDTPSRDND